MTDESPTEAAPAARRIALAALLTGISGDVLLRWVPWGAGALLWTIGVLVTAAVLFHHLRPQRVADLLLPFTGALVAATGLVWRDAEMLTLLDVCLLIASLSILILGPQGVAAWNSGLSRVLTALLKGLGEALAGFFKLGFDELEWRQLLSAAPGRSGSLLRGAIIAFPALLIFGSLLASADMAFANLLEDVLVLDFGDLALHALLAAWITALFAGFYYALVRGERGSGFSRPSFLQLGAGDVAIAMILIDVLFAAFVAVQFRYLFGGAELVRIAPNLTRAEYARSGFFQLVWVVMLVVPMLLVAEWIIDKSHPAAVRTFRAAAGIQVALVLIIAASAWQRMALYRAAFGLTEQRLHTTAFMIWLGALLIWLAVTVLTGHRGRFFVGMAVSGLVALFTLHWINPDEMIVATNSALSRTSDREFDGEYAYRLSADALPSALRAQLPMACTAKNILARDARRPAKWRTWNWSRHQAHDAIEVHRAELEQLAKACDPATSRTPPHPR